MSVDRDRGWTAAAESLGFAVADRRRPNPALWLWYAFWGPLPERYDTWVLYDTTSATWVVRHVARILATAAVPVAAIAIFLPAGGELRGVTAFMAGACATLFTVVWINESTEHRLGQAGYDWGTGEALRARRAELSRRR